MNVVILMAHNELRRAVNGTVRRIPGTARCRRNGVLVRCRRGPPPPVVPDPAGRGADQRPKSLRFEAHAMMGLNRAGAAAASESLGDVPCMFRGVRRGYQLVRFYSPTHRVPKLAIRGFAKARAICPCIPLFLSRFIGGGGEPAIFFFFFFFGDGGAVAGPSDAPRDWGSSIRSVSGSFHKPEQRHREQRLNLKARTVHTPKDSYHRQGSRRCQLSLLLPGAPSH